jgi:hypothetical protein
MLTVIDTVLSAKSFPGEDELYELLVVEALTTTGTRILSIAKLTTPRNWENLWCNMEGQRERQFRRMS